ncbi:hypothetical protein BJ508DRAFT_416571 [Ascobolus immersus RN42]|uniref:F-box domain-containing protein n=1 Tax=Ascobolus immersus RN42 TaxID=1160509 RepID=A0A3N4HWT4_ASCIM|nr:hypothetical protein BJ508DRAFT_416571 [Ascobolus immersus RN42]
MSNLLLSSDDLARQWQLGDSNGGTSESCRAPSQAPFPVFALPAELRCEVYSFCSAFTLLQLTLASPRICAEINTHPTLIRDSFGCNIAKYTHNTVRPAHSVDLIRFLNGDDELRLYCEQFHHQDCLKGEHECMWCWQWEDTKDVEDEMLRAKLLAKRSYRAGGTDYDVCEVCLHVRKVCREDWNRIT